MRFRISALERISTKRNELGVAAKHREDWRLLRLWNFSRGPKAFELRPPLDAHVSLVPTTFRAEWG